MRDAGAVNAPAPQAPARRRPATPLHTYNSHRKAARPPLADRRLYRPVRRHTLSRIDEAPRTPRPGSESLQRLSTRPMRERSRSNISADTSRSVPVCNESREVGNQNERHSPPYAEPRYDSASSYDLPASMSDLPAAVPVDRAAGAYIPYPEYAYYDDAPAHRWKRSGKASAKHTNLYLAFMY